MIYHEIRDKEGNVLASNLKDFPRLSIFSGQDTENVTVSGHKNVYRVYDTGTVRLIATPDENFTANIATRTAKAFSGLVSSVGSIKSEAQDIFKILSHNLVTAYGKLQGEIESVLNARDLSRCNTHAEQRDVAAQSIRHNEGDAAEAILQISKRAIDIQAQIQGFKMLSESVSLDYDSHNIKRILLNILYPFYEEFENANIRVHINIEDDIAEDNPVLLDYKVFNVAMHHFFNNAVKYVKPYSIIYINFAPQEQQIEISMMSIKIDRDELTSVKTLKFSGRHVGLLAGDGIGMFMLDRSLSLMGWNMDIAPDYTKLELVEGIPYVKNVFRFMLPDAVI